MVGKATNGTPYVVARTDYYPFGMPMPGRNLEGNYRYKFQGQEKDPETGMKAFELRLWDARIGRWLTTDPAGEFFSPYIGMGNMPIVAVDPDGGDIIILIASDAVGGLGHAAVLIGNDKDGWRYYSKNGTSGVSKPYGKSYKPDLGNIYYGQAGANDFRKTGLTAKEVMKIVNKSNPEHHHNYDKYIRITTTNIEDDIAAKEAHKEAKGPKYNIFGDSCIDVPQEALKSVFLSRIGESEMAVFRPDYGFSDLTPLFWTLNLIDSTPDGHLNTMNKTLQVANKPFISTELIEIGIDDGN